jgi:hypothetical protein
MALCHENSSHNSWKWDLTSKWNNIWWLFICLLVVLSVERLPRLRDHHATMTKFPQSRMVSSLVSFLVSSLISVNWPSLARLPRYPDRDHWLGESQTANSPLMRPKSLIGHNRGSNYHLAAQRSTENAVLIISNSDNDHGKPWKRDAIEVLLESKLYGSQCLANILSAACAACNAINHIIGFAAHICQPKTT